jgi:Protein of unknown function (DUF992)
MHPIVNTCRLGIIAGLALFLATQANHSEAASPSGGLRCAVEEGSSRILGSTRALDCVYTSDGGGREHYRGTIDKYGPDIGYQRRGMIYWAVLSPDMVGRRGELAGHYIGASAGVVVGPGLHANALVGGNKIMLNPISFGDANGLNVAATLTDLQLVYVGTGGRRH